MQFYSDLNGYTFRNPAAKPWTIRRTFCRSDPVRIPESSQFSVIPDLVGKCKRFHYILWIFFWINMENMLAYPVLIWYDADKERFRWLLHLFFSLPISSLTRPSKRTKYIILLSAPGHCGKTAERNFRERWQAAFPAFLLFHFENPESSEDKNRMPLWTAC